MSTVEFENCIDPNPDVSGIGVRISVYAQAFFTLVPAVWYFEGMISRNQAEFEVETYTNLIVTASGILVTAYLQVAAHSLSAYHALIVLNLSWINTFNSVTSGVLLRAREESYRRKFRPADYFASAHLCSMAALGLLVWTKIDGFGDEPECMTTPFLTLLGRDIVATNRTLRMISIVIYAITAVPGLNSIILNALLMFIPVPILAFFAFLTRKGHFSIATKVRAAGLIVAIANVIFILDTELMIKRGKHLVRGGDDWTFGQTVTLVLPIVSLVKMAAAWYRDRKQRPGESGRRGPTDIETLPLI